jgi:hypothetical protein
MHLELAALCDAATEHAGKLNILGVFDTIASPEYPFVYPQCAFACRVRFHRIEAGKHSLNLNFVDEDGSNILPPLNANLDIQFPHQAESLVSNMILNIQGLKIPKAGKYSLDLALDNRQEITIPLRAVLISKNDANIPDLPHKEEDEDPKNF